MSNKVLSFLGTTKYTEVYHTFNGMTTETCHPFAQEAILELFCKHWTENDSIIVFLTQEAKNKNWLSKENNNSTNFDKGLKERLDNLKSKYNINIQIKDIDIKDGKSEDELWEIFTTIINNIDEGDKIIFDITHSFRSLPMLALAVLNYAKFSKGIVVDKILYGALEAKSPQEVKKMAVEDRLIPLFDLTQFVDLFDWTVAIEKFLEAGDARSINKLGEKGLKALLTETKGKIGNNLNALVKRLGEFSNVILTCRGPEIKEKIQRIQESIPKAKEEINVLKPLVPLFDKIDNKFAKMSCNDHVQSGLEAVEWCLNYGLIQQGFTILRETIVNYVILEYINNNASDEDLKDKNNRELAECILNTGSKMISKNVIELWKNMADYRNDINHAGWRKDNYHKSDDFYKKLCEYINQARTYIT